jgi:hypothetical protein
MFGVTRFAQHRMRQTDMNTNFYRESATIYEFPAGGRAAFGSLRDASKPAAVTSLRVPKTVFGSGWYHEAAVQEAEQTRKS